MTQQVIPKAAVEAAAKVSFGLANPGTAWENVEPHWKAAYLANQSAALEAAAPHMLAGVTALADAWEARGEHDMKVSKTIKDEYIATEILGHGAQMVENARHIRNAIVGRSQA